MGYYRSSHHHTYMPSGTDLLRNVKPNMKSTYKAAKIRTGLCACLIPVGFILFVTGGFMGVSSFNPGFPPGVLIGFFMFGAGGFLTVFSSISIAKLKHLIGLIDEIQGHDKVSLESLSLHGTIGKSSLMLIIKKLINTGNLNEYELIGESGVAKKSIQARENDFTSTTSTATATASAWAENTPPPPKRCPNCGASVTEKNERTCRFCNSRL